MTVITYPGFDTRKSMLVKCAPDNAIYFRREAMRLKAGVY